MKTFKKLMGILFGLTGFLCWFLAFCVILKIAYQQFFDILFTIGATIAGLFLFGAGCTMITAAGKVGDVQEYLEDDRK